MKDILHKVGIVRSPNKTSQLFEDLFAPQSFLDIVYSSPKDYVEMYWEKYKESGKNDNSTNGKIFEYIIATLFVRENILPLYVQAKVAFVPNVDFDNIVYCKEFGPIAFSVKTTLRERYKQADLEAVSLKYVHRKAKCFLLTLDKNEHNSVNAKIKEGDVLGLDRAILCTSNEIDDLIKELKSYNLALAGNVDVISSQQVVDSESVDKIKTDAKMQMLAKIKSERLKLKK